MLHDKFSGVGDVVLSGLCNNTPAPTAPARSSLLLFLVTTTLAPGKTFAKFCSKFGQYPDETLA